MGLFEYFPALAAVLCQMRCGSCCLSAGTLSVILVLRYVCSSGTLGISRAKRVAVERKLHENTVLFCPLQETHLASAERAALKIGGSQHMWQARAPHVGGAPILIRDGVGVEVGVLGKKVAQRATVTLRLSVSVNLTIASAYFPRNSDISSESLDTLLGASAPLVAGADANSHHVLWDPFRPSGGKGECIVDWCVCRRKRFDSHVGSSKHLC
ncbi:hypothetical protein ERJ75_001713000 [Trypanosoma vivax]|nr:hypothetical protein ERJ75_001713000 [Trypanosoma vivax]